MAAQLIHVVRHAHAGDRAAWSLDDDLRPLSDRGVGQAERLPTQLGEAPAAVYSSASLRCLATVVPLARAHRLPITTLHELYEGGRAGVMLQRLSGLRASPLVACTHGDLLEDLLALLHARGVALPTIQAAKGSTWTLEVDGGVVRSARYAPPP